jgi:hypothetical protein
VKLTGKITGWIAPRCDFKVADILTVKGGTEIVEYFGEGATNMSQGTIIWVLRQIFYDFCVVICAGICCELLDVRRVAVRCC